MKLIIVRHGQTEENKAGIIQGHLPGHLSKSGLQQVKKLAKRLKDEQIDFIYSSDLDRAVQTTQEIAKFHPETPIEFTEKLRETFLGEWQGKSKVELGFTMETNMAKHQPSDGESYPEIFKRAQSFLDQIFQKHPGKTILLSAHNGINKALIAVLTGRNAKQIPNLENLKNTSVSTFQIGNQSPHEMLTFNCSKHLQK